MDETPTPSLPDQPPAAPPPSELPPGIKVYERPARRAIPLWLVLGLLLVLSLFAWFGYQALF